jgi:glycosyltransferase involved in cell wall biosynthesis
MKIYISPQFDKPDSGDGGIRRVVEAQHRYLPDFGVMLVSDYKQADLINCHGTSIEMHERLVLSLHGLYWAEYEWPKWYLNANRWLIRGIKHARAITAPSEWVANSIRRGTLANPIVCYHGIDLAQWSPGNPAGYVLWNKNRQDAVCNPEPMNYLAARVSGQPFISTFGQATPNVKIVGKLPFAEMTEYIRGASVYLATARETLGVGTLEAMACAVPVLGWRYGGQRELVTHLETGYLAEYGNYDDLLQGLYYCLQHRDRLGTNARQSVIEKWQWKDVIYAYVKAYEQALQPPPERTVSIICTAYNLAAYLPDAIESVLCQPFSDWELIIVDDHSPDTCGEIAERYAAQDPRIRVIHNAKNVYLAEARNIGIRAARGKYILPLDADDMLGDDALGRLVRALDQDPALDIVTGSMEVLEENGRRWVSQWPSASTISYSAQISKQNQIPYASMYRRGVWERLGGYRRRMKSAEDAEFWTRAMSYGYVAKKVTEAPTLIYRNRAASMSHVEKEPDWKAWMTWVKMPSLLPYAGGGPVWSYGPLLLSVVIPVGPKHVSYLQDSLDSLIAQTFKEWEVIVVNDTGKSLTLPGYPFARIIDTPGNRGPAYARNRGFEAAQTELVVLLDADDYFQPMALESLYKASQTRDGWFYPDWFADDGKEIYPQQARSWSTEQLKIKMLGPSTGLYRKADWEKVGGFDEDCPGWEDWNFQLKLLEHCICGTRIAFPLFVYRYRLGTNRDRDFENKENLLHYIVSRRKALYEGSPMVCAGCGKRNDLVVKAANRPPQPANDTLITVEYIGDNLGSRQVRSQIRSGHYYRFSANHRIFEVYASEVDRFVNKPTEFRVLHEATQEPEDFVLEEGPMITADRSYEPPPEEIALEPDHFVVDMTKLDYAVMGRLRKAGFDTAEKIALANDATLLAIKGIGQKRLQEIRGAIGRA